MCLRVEALKHYQPLTQIRHLCRYGQIGREVQFPRLDLRVYFTGHRILNRSTGKEEKDAVVCIGFSYSG